MKAPIHGELDRNDRPQAFGTYGRCEGMRQGVKCYSPLYVLRSPLRLWSIAALVKNFSRSKKKMSGIVRHGWMKPKEDFVKLNVDAGFDLDSGT